MIANYDKILLDVSGTLYCNQKKPIDGARDFLKKYSEKIIIFSNIGSKTGVELKEELNAIFNISIPQVVTSLDLLLKFIEQKSYNTIFHYGNEKVIEKIKPFVKKIAKDDHEKDIDAIIFTSLISNRWIESTEAALNIILKKDTDILLGNPDRISPEPPFHFTVTLILDSLLNLSKTLDNKKNVKEFGKPYLTKEMIYINKNEKLITIGDNPWTDIKQGNQFQCDSILLSSQSKTYKGNLSPTFIAKSLKELL